MNRDLPPDSGAASGFGHFAPGIVGPVPVEADHAPLDPEARADEAAVLDDRVEHRALGAVRNERIGATEATRDGAGHPRPERDLTHVLEVDDLEIGVPETAFLGAEGGSDFAQRERVAAQR